MDYGFCKIRLVRYSGGTAGELHPFPYYPRSTAAAVRGTSSFSLIPAGCLTYKTSVSPPRGKYPCFQACRIAAGYFTALLRIIYD